MSEEEFINSASPMIGCHVVIAVKWAGMIIGIEPDGYTHS